MKVLVTGATGFIGEWVMKELWAKGHTPIAFTGDIRDESILPEEFIEVIIHLASLVPHRGQRSIEAFHDVNVRGTENLLRIYPKAKIVYVSTKDVTRAQISEYAKTKLEAEKIVEERGNCVIVRLPSVFGPKQRQNKLIPLLFKKYCQGSECTITNNDLREYIYVKDVAEGLVDAMDRDGIITPVGSVIRNKNLDKLIHAVYLGEDFSDESPLVYGLFTDLKQCLPTYQRKLFFDLDGTLIDGSEKNYRVYTDLLSEAGFSTVSKVEYWEAKRSKVPEDQILAMTDAGRYYKEYNRKRLLSIENDYYLSLDSLHEGAIEVLESLSKKYQLILVTLREYRPQLNKQLVNLGIRDYFVDVLSLGEELLPRWKMKDNLISKYLKGEPDSSSILIGDTESDMEAGHKLGFKTIAVLNGIRSEANLLRSNPDIICSSIANLVKEIGQ